jgi:exodeoxyribonuclease V beta subunit
LSRAIGEGFSVTSFTALTQAEDHRIAEVLADRDYASGQPVEAPPSAPLAAAGGRYSFPRGAQAGVCLHAILENLGFDGRQRQDPLFRDQLRRAGYEPAWAPELQNWLFDVVRVPLRCPSTGVSFQLADIPPAAQGREMAFHLATRDLSPAQLAGVASRHGFPVSGLTPARLSGYLSGFIDLVFEHDGRWYLADYKSNWLGGERSHYDEQGMAQAMAQGDYHLQYLLYVVAMHRLLRHRLADYDYERHWGGVFYLFLRGMHPDPSAGKGMQDGVYVARPPKALIECIDDLLGGVSVPAEEQIA